MLALEDPRWSELEGGYRRPYDPRPALVRLQADGNDEKAWSELWNELHHQGDVGVASYATVPHLVHIFRNKPRNWNFYALIATIEVEQHGGHNPAVPNWMLESYKEAIQTLLTFAADDIVKESDEMFLRSLLGAIAAAKGSLLRAKLMGDFSDEELGEMLEKYWCS